MGETRAFLDALEDLDEALDENVERARRMKERITELRTALSAGRPLREVIPAEEPPLIVRLLTDSARVLDSYGSRVRRTEARALYREGMTMDQIALLFGVSRQRISALLRDDSPEAG
jgi:uncharacterized protein YjcR